MWVWVRMVWLLMRGIKLWGRRDASGRVGMRCGDGVGLNWMLKMGVNVIVMIVNCGERFGCVVRMGD